MISKKTMKVSFIESGMDFEFEAAKLYRIEKSSVVGKMQSFKTCECVVSSSKGLNFIEAKTNAPNPKNKTNKEGIDLFWNNVEQKFIDSMLFTTSIIENRNNDADCPAIITNSQIMSVNYRFILIIKDLETRFLPEQMLCFKQRLKHIAKAWNVSDSDIVVLNEDIARKQKYIK